MKLRYPILLIAILALLILFSPLVYLEIGPQGKLYYGPTVPDIHIHGGWITGKDLRWQPIYFAQIFQRTCILLYAALAFASLFLKKRSSLLALWYINLSLLIFFPFWLAEYVSHVLNNSDGAAADMGFSYHYGLFLYALIFILNAGVLVQIHRRVKAIYPWTPEF